MNQLYNTDMTEQMAHLNIDEIVKGINVLLDKSFYFQKGWQ